MLERVNKKNMSVMMNEIKTIDGGQKDAILRKANIKNSRLQYLAFLLMMVVKI